MYTTFKSLSIEPGIISYEYLTRCIYLSHEKYRKDNLVMECNCKMIIHNILTKDKFEIKGGFSWWLNNPAHHSFINIHVKDQNSLIKIYETKDIYPYHEISKDYIYSSKQIIKSSFHIPPLVYIHLKRVFVWDKELDTLKHNYIHNFFENFLKDITVHERQIIKKPHKVLNKVFIPSMQFIDEYHTYGSKIYDKYKVKEGVNNIHELEPDIFTKYKIASGLYKNMFFSQKNGDYYVLIIYNDDTLTLEKFTPKDCPETYITFFGNSQITT